MSRDVFSSSTVPDKLIQLLVDELPHSLPLLRRLQFTKFDNGTTPHALIVVASEVGGLGDDSRRPKAFTAAYLDFSVDNETQMYLYSTLERDQGSERATKGEYERQIANVVQEIIHLGKEYGKEEKSTNLDCVLLGSVHSEVRSILEDKFGRILPRPSGNFDKWLFRIEELPEFDDSLPFGMYWDTAAPDDCRIVVSRTSIPREVEALVRLPNVMIKLEDDKAPIAWGFLSIDGSIISIHCEHAYRRKGLAKKLATKLIRENNARFGNDGWCCADVAAHNEASRAMCKALNGKPDWIVSWVFLVLAEPKSLKNPSKN